MRMSLEIHRYRPPPSPISRPLCTRYRFAAATRFTISATDFHFFRMMGRFANLTEMPFPLIYPKYLLIPS